jgi:hypothetical protein
MQEMLAIACRQLGMRLMRVISAKILDATHLELSQPLDASPGDMVEISLLSGPDEDMELWRDAAKQHLLDAYADEDAVYDEL